MYFTLAKIFWLLFAPANLIIIFLSLGGWLLMIGRRFSGLVLFLLGFVALILGSVSSLPDRALEVLETQFPRCDVNPAHLDGVIVLGGAVNIETSVVWDQLLIGKAGNRLLMMADLARRYPESKIIFTGGYGALSGKPVAEADLLAKYSTVLGLDPARIQFESNSRNTIENAVYTKQLIDPKPDEKWLLVTSASHMPRAYGMFRKMGIPVEACATDYQTRPGYEDGAFNFDFAERLQLVNLVTREYLGLIAARLYDYTDAVIPGPDSNPAH